MKGVYSHSGRLGAGLIVVPLVGIVAALVLGLVYAYIDVYSPIAGYVSILFVLGFAVALGAAVSRAGAVAKVRSTGFMAAAGLLIGLLALYASWAGFEAALLSKGDDAPADAPGYLDLLTRPVAVWRIAQLINETGWYSIKSATPSGVLLWIFWGVEAAIVVGGAALIAPGGISDEVFCEGCDRWCAPAPRPANLGLPADAQVLDQATGGDAAALDALEALPTVAGDEQAHLQVVMKRCGACSDTASFQVKLITRSLDKEGKVNVETKDLTPQHLVDDAAYRRLEALAAREPSPPSAQPPSAPPSAPPAGGLPVG